MTKPANTPVPTSLKLLTAQMQGLHRTDSFRIDPDLIKFEEGFNLRADNEETAIHINRLYLAMKAGAFMPPVDVAVIDGLVIARDGHCRTLAACRLKKEVPDYTLECRQLRGNEADAVLHMLGTGSGGKPLSPLEQGLGYLRLIRFGLKPADIASKLGITRQTVDNGLILAEAPVDVQQMIKEGDVSATTARETLQQGKEAVDALKTAVAEEKKNPTKKKNGKKKKVTAKTLKGTKADKKAKGKKGKKKKDTTPEPPASTLPTPDPIPVDPNIINLTITREVATAVFENIRDFGGEGNPHLITMRNTLETALL